MFKVKLLGSGILAVLLGAGLTRISYSMIVGAPINVIDKGADPTGAVDAKPAIQAAVTLACANGKSVYIPSGTYLVGSTITACGNITIYGDGATSVLRPTISDGVSYVLRFPPGSGFFKLKDFAILSTINSTNFNAGTAAAQQSGGLQIASTLPNGPFSSRFSVSNVHVYGVKTAFDVSGFISTWENAWADYNEIGFRGDTLNSADLNLRLENNRQDFAFTASGGILVRQLIAEGANVNAVASVIDNVNGITFSSPYFEDAANGGVLRPTPFLSVGPTTLVQNLTITGGSMFGGSGMAFDVYPIVMDKVSGAYIDIGIGVSSQLRAVSTTANTKDYYFRPLPHLAGQTTAANFLGGQDGSGQQAPAFNYWPNRRFDLGLKGWAIGPQSVNRATPALETSIVRGGQKQSLRVTAQVGQNQNHSEIHITGSVVTALRGTTMRAGAWVWVPNISAFDAAVWATGLTPAGIYFPAIYLQSTNAVPTTIQSATANNIMARGAWNFVTATLAIQSDATDIAVSINPNNGPNNGTGAEFIVVSSITLTEDSTPLARQMNDSLIDSPLISSIAVGGKLISSGSAAPTDTLQTYAVGDLVWNTGVVAGGSPGWVCTTGGSPGVWKAMANVAP